jgi:hypothetical protein
MKNRLIDGEVVVPGEMPMPTKGYMIHIAGAIIPNEVQLKAIRETFGLVGNYHPWESPMFVYFQTQRKAKAALLRYQLFCAAYSGIASDGNASLHKCDSSSLGAKRWGQKKVTP